MAQLQEALRQAGLESSNLIVGIDFTKSNQWTGKESFGGLSLHSILAQSVMNPYQRVIDVLGRTLSAFDDDQKIPAYGFGDATTTDRSVFPFCPNEIPCEGFKGVLNAYNDIVLSPNLQLAGPTSFVPIIHKAIEITYRTGGYHILVIVCDGQVMDEAETQQAICQATDYPLSIVVVGVGDGPFGFLEKMDDCMKGRKFDNLQFVEFHKVHDSPTCENPEVAFALAALQEIPSCYQIIRGRGLLRETSVPAFLLPPH